MESIAMPRVGAQWTGEHTALPTAPQCEARRKRDQEAENVRDEHGASPALIAEHG